MNNKILIKRKNNLRVKKGKIFKIIFYIINLKVKNTKTKFNHLFLKIYKLNDINFIISFKLI